MSRSRAALAAWAAGVAALGVVGGCAAPGGPRSTAWSDAAVPGDGARGPSAVAALSSSGKPRDATGTLSKLAKQDIPARRTVVAPMPRREGPPEDPGLVALGRAIFADGRLSVPEGTSCASCHDPSRAFSGSHGSSVGVPQGSRAGHFARRSSPSVMYLKYVPRFHYFEEDEAPAPAPFGGFFWDGRADTIADLVREPLYNPDEMNAGSAQRVAAQVAWGPYASELRARFGSTSDPAVVVRGIGSALEAYLTSDEMAPATSKYDAYVRGEATLTPLEKRGLEAFKDPMRGACASCHRMNETSTNPARSMFTDYGFDAVGAPRNRDLPPRAYDLGLCERKDTRTPSTADKWCGSFRTPSLRNVAVRPSLMHSGAFRSLRDVVVFYATRATQPGRWYPPGQTFDDLPEKYRENVNTLSSPYNGSEGGTPPLGDADIDAIVAFLRTLTDAAYVGAEP